MIDNNHPASAASHQFAALTAAVSTPRLAAFAATALLAACGGGGSDGSSTPATVANQAVGGLWSASYTAADGSPIQTVFLATEDGRSFGLSRNLRNNCVGIAHGNLAANGSNLTGSFQFMLATYSSGGAINTSCTYADGTTAGTSAITGTVSQRSTLTMTSGGQTSGGLVLPSETHTFQFDPLYNTASSTASIAGNWTAVDGSPFSISATGAYVEVSRTIGCTITLQIDPVNTAYNAYQVTGSIRGCSTAYASLNAANVTGFATVDNSTSPKSLFIGLDVALANGSRVLLFDTATR